MSGMVLRNHGWKRYNVRMGWNKATRYKVVEGIHVARD